jgi:hypothetical protein
MMPLHVPVAMDYRQRFLSRLPLNLAVSLPVRLGRLGSNSHWDLHCQLVNPESGDLQCLSERRPERPVVLALLLPLVGANLY